MNQLTLLGRVGKDPEVKTVGDNTVCNFSIATSRKWKDADGEQQEKTIWHNCSLWGKSGDVFTKHVKKGDGILVQGEQDNYEYEKDGNKRYGSRVNVRMWEFVPTRKDGSSGDSNSGADDGAGDKGSESSTKAKADDDDLPF